MRIGFYLMFMMLMQIMIGVVVTMTSETGEQTWIATPEGTGVNLQSSSITEGTTSSMETATYGNAKGAGQMLWNVMINSVNTLNPLLEGGNLTLILNYAIIIFRTLIGALTLVALYALIRGWVQF